MSRARDLRAIQITAAEVLPEEALFARIRALGALPPEARRAFAVELRDPALPARALLALGRRLRAETLSLGASLIVNDRLDLAQILGADGIHLGRRSVPVAEARAFLGPGPFVSVACHSVDDVFQAVTMGADVVKLSPIFASPGKGAPLGPGALTVAREALDRLGKREVCLWALGGVDAGNAASCLSAGASALSSIRADLSTLLACLAN
ncbi:MAG: thiamine phosphate synthase [Byssovorax sp.]